MLKTTQTRWRYITHDHTQNSTISVVFKCFFNAVESVSDFGGQDCSIAYEHTLWKHFLPFASV